jgi:hypothetical protein
MNFIARPTTALAAAPSRASHRSNPGSAPLIFRAAQLIAPDLARGEKIDAARLSAAMTSVFGGTDAEGRWLWKYAYCLAAPKPANRK